MITVNDLRLEGLFHIEHLRDDCVIGIYDVKNGICDDGRKLLLDGIFVAGASYSWYVGLLDTTFAPNDSNDLLSSMSGYEFTDYTDANNGDSGTTRPLWDTDVPAKVSTNIEVTNDVGTPYMIYDITASENVWGVFVCSVQNKSSYPGGAYQLWSTANFTSSISVVSGDTLQVSYTVRTPAA